MLYYLFQYLDELNVPGAGMFKYVSFRSGLALILSLFIATAIGRRIIDRLQYLQIGETVRNLGLEGQMSKKGTPTMGGLLILGSAIISMLICADLHNSFVWISILVLLVYGLTGFVDDYVKVTKQTANAMTAKMKLFLQFTTALIAVWIISQATPENSRFELTFPWFKNFALNLSWFYIPFAMVVIAGASNAVNLSDGLDGLASGLLVVSFIVFAIVAYLCGTEFAPLFSLLPIPHAAEIVIVCAAVIGGCVGFLWFKLLFSYLVLQCTADTRTSVGNGGHRFGAS